MASSSDEVKYDVFLSFRGEDTRDNFTSHLNAALCQKRISTFIDDQLVRGDEISPSLLNAIRRSKISIFIFSQGYASSTWCLRELVEILNCKRMYGQVVIPVFYHVKPTDVRKQTGTYGDAFGQHEVRYMEEKEMLQRWRNALTEAADISGINSNSIRPESKLNDKIIECILKRLNDKSYSDNKNLVGVAMKIQKIKSLLADQSSKVRKVGLWGMGGVGKTTLAEAVFHEISSQFEASHFARNVREEASNKSQLCQLQKELLRAILEDEHLDINHTSTIKRLRRKRVLIVFDDVTNLKQIKGLIGDIEYLGFGSQVIITTRDKQVLTICRLGESTIYEVKGLDSDESLELFKQHAFIKNHSIDEVYLKLSEEVISYIGGLPLALEVLGGHLLGREKLIWESALDDLQKYPNENIQKMLKISYDGLSNRQKTLSLDIACFFKGWNKYLVSTFGSLNEMSVLVDKALISIPCTTIRTHDLIQEMGWKIIRQESINNLGHRSRLWHHDDVYRVLNKTLGTDKIRCMLFNMVEMRKIYLNPHAFSEMANLRLLIVNNSYSRYDIKVHGFDNIEFDFSELECLCWDYYPFPSLPLKFDPDNLVVLNMQNSNLKRLWMGIKELAHLNYIDLSYSKDLLEVPDLSKALKLERLILEDCTSLLEITPPTRNPNKLVELNLRNYKSLIRLPIPTSESLRDVILSGCSNLNTAPTISCNMERLCLDGTAIKNLSSSIERPSRLVELNLKDCLSLESLPSSVCNLTSLKYLCISDCSKLERLPDDLGKLESLERIEASRITVKELPSLMAGWLAPGLSKLERLDLNYCNITELPKNIDNLSLLSELNLEANNLDSIPTNIMNLSKLQTLNIRFCYRLRSLPKLPCNTRLLKADDCKLLDALSGFTPGLYKRKLNLFNCVSLDREAIRNICYDSILDTFSDAFYQCKYKNQGFEEPRVEINFPGSDIPNWFNIPGSGSVVKIPQGLFNEKCLGLAFCVIVEVEDNRDRYDVCYFSYELQVMCAGEKTKSRRGEILLFPKIIKSDHVLLRYNYDIWKTLMEEDIEFDCDKEAIISFSPTSGGSFFQGRMG